MAHAFVTDDELLDIYRENERERDKLELRIGRLEDTMAVARSKEKKGDAADWVKRADYERLQEEFDELCDIVKELAGKCIEMSLALDLDFEKLGT